LTESCGYVVAAQQPSLPGWAIMKTYPTESFALADVTNYSSPRDIENWNGGWQVSRNNTGFYGLLTLRNNIYFIKMWYNINTILPQWWAWINSCVFGV